MTDPSAPLSVYLHVPFCVHRCAYCDFNTYAGQEASIPSYVDALVNEINYLGQATARLPDDQTIGTIFFGGGTPSLLSPPQLASVMDALRAAFALSPHLEVTLEANPGTTSPDDLHRLRAIGINRLSYGVQSANPGELRLLERAHDFFDVIASVKWARQAGFDNLNLDLIYGLPEQTLADWQTSLRRVLDLHPEHLSLYALTLEHGAPFGRWAARGLLPTPDPDLAADMYEWAGEYLSANGYVQYEISNWAKANSEFRLQTSEFMCRHNLQYWRGLPYLGLGAGAHGYANGYRYSNALRIKTYIERFTAGQFPITSYQFPLTPAAVNQHRQTPQDDMSEFMLNGLRLTREGVSPETFRARFGRDLRAVFGREVEELLRLGLLEWAGESPSPARRGDRGEVLRLTVRGRLLGNQAFLRFV
ncbi:MAG: radical SAM family heme chaperone HemW [Chloroflexota bacterium]